MLRKNFFFFIPYVIICSFFNFATALLGRNVREAVPGEYPSAVCILKRNNDNRTLRNDVRCTGALITRGHVLTSEHCFEGLGPDGIYVAAGSIDLRQSTPHYIDWWITYQQWATVTNVQIEFSFNDIAIIKLLEKVHRRIPPAVVSPYARTDLFGRQVTLAGWGKLADGNPPFVLHAVNVTVISNEDCQTLAQRITGRFINLNQRYICTFDDPWALLNYGDSGGPVYIGSLIAGVNQGTCPEAGDPHDPRKASLHCSVDYYRHFIEENMRI